ncbi:MAG: DUF427 domain-containing protein [Alphaproteobacteria bacterium]
MAQAATTDERRSAFADNPDYRVDFEPVSRRVRVVFGGETVADSTRARLMLETRHLPVYYFPRDDLRMDLATRSDHHSFCPFKGEASYWTLEVGGKRAEDAMWSYETPFPEVAGIAEYVAFYWDRMDAWYEEDDEVLGHPRDPRVRVDVLNSSRGVRVTLGGETLAETRRARFLFETGMPARYYIPRADVRMALLEPGETRSVCPYKGRAVYFNARIDGRVVENVAWSYPAPLPECALIEGCLCFYPERVDTIAVEGAPPD